MKLNLFNRSSKRSLEKRFTTFSEQLATAFGRIKDDINEAHSRTSNLEEDTRRLKEWINYLNAQNSYLKNQNAHLGQKYAQIKTYSQRLDQKHDALHEAHTRISADTESVSRKVENHHEHLKTHKSEVSELLDTHKSHLKKALENHENLTKEEIERLKRWISYYLTLTDKQQEKEKALEAELSSLKDSLSEATNSSEKTINALRSDNDALKEQLSTVSDELEDLRSGLISTKSELSETKEELENTQKSIENLRNLAESETSKQISQQETPQKIQDYPSKTSRSQQIGHYTPPPQHSPFEKHIISRVMPNRKGYIMRFIVDLASEKKYSTKEIEEIVVKEKNLCGRTSFYAYLKELKLRGRIGYANIDERNIIVNLEPRQPDLNNFTKSED